MIDPKTLPSEPPADLNEALEWMNARHAVALEQGKARVLTFSYDIALRRRTILRSGFDDIRNLYSCNEYITHMTMHRGRETPAYSDLGRFWLKWPGRRRYNKGIYFAPNEPERDGYLNLWEGFPVEPQPGDWSPFRDFMKEVICAGNDEHFAYLLNWIARLVQYPNKVGQVAVVLRGRQGTGKGTFARAISDLFDQYAVHISHPRQLTGNFNAHLQDCCVLFADEAFWAGDKEAEGTLKRIITEPTNFIEPKGINGYSVPNYVHVILASNHDWVVPAGEDERRYFVLDVSSERMQNTAYFDKLNQWLSTDQAKSAILHYFQHSHDITEFDVFRVPRTVALLDQQDASLDPIGRWWKSKLVDGVLSDDHDTWLTQVPFKGLYDDYCNAPFLNGSRWKATPAQLSRLVRKYIPYLRVSQQRIHEQRVRCWQLPPLDVCRAAWNEYTGQNVDWSECSVEEEINEPSAP